MKTTKQPLSLSAVWDPRSSKNFPQQNCTLYSADLLLLQKESLQKQAVESSEVAELRLCMYCSIFPLK